MEVCLMDYGPSGRNNTMDNHDSKREMISSGVMGLIVGVSLTVAGILVGSQLHIVWNTWPSTDGVVARGSVQETLPVPNSKGGLPIRRYTPQIEFRYTVDGKGYTSKAPSVYTADTFEKAAANLIHMYAPGTHHPIRYNPRNPGEIEFGIIKFGTLAFSFLLLISGVALSASGVDSLVKAYSQSAAVAPAKAQGTTATLLPFADRAREEPAPVRCPACGRPVIATADSFPNCLKSLRAA